MREKRFRPKRSIRPRNCFGPFSGKPSAPVLHPTYSGACPPVLTKGRCCVTGWLQRSRLGCPACNVFCTGGVCPRLERPLLARLAALGQTAGKRGLEGDVATMTREEQNLSTNNISTICFQEQAKHFMSSSKHLCRIYNLIQTTFASSP